MIVVQLGQYGNEIAPELLDHLHKRASKLESVDDVFFRESPTCSELTPRAVLIDMEPKAIQRSCFDMKHDYKYAEEQKICGQSGSGNNWALGYVENGRQMLGLFKTKLRHEMEKLDGPPTFCAFSSLGGGTGSGLGSYLIQYLKYTHPKSFLLANSVIPFVSGEIAVEDINAALSLATTEEAADLLILCANDEAADCVRKYTGQKRLPSLSELNEIISTNLAGEFAGVRPSSIFHDISYSKFNNIIAARTAPAFPGDTMRKFPSVFSHLEKMCETGSGSDYQMNWQDTSEIKIFGARYCIRGPGSQAILENRFFDGEKLLKESWGDFVAFSQKHEGVCEAFDDSLLAGPMASALINSGCYNPNISAICDSVIKKCAAGAYVHRYERFGVTKESILASVQELREVVSDYE